MTTQSTIENPQSAMPLKAPFPWFGGKRRVAHIVWDRFGCVPNYVEPFAGSLAVLLGRPHELGSRAECHRWKDREMKLGLVGKRQVEAKAGVDVSHGWRN